MTQCGVKPLAAVLAGLLLPALVHGQDVTASFSTSPEKLPEVLHLSDVIRVTLKFTGPSPLRIELPEKLLTRETGANWLLRPAEGRTPAPIPIGGGREEWSREFLLSPFPPPEGEDTLSLEFAPVKVNGRPVNPGGFTVNVRRPDGGATPAGITDIEQLPPVSDNEVSRVPWLLLWGGCVVIAVAVLWVWRVRRPAPPVPASEWATAAFNRLEASRASGAALAHGIAAILRGFIDRQFHLPASKLTTTELLAATEQSGWPVEDADSLRGLLNDCDRARFAGHVPNDDGCRGLLARARDWVHHIGSRGSGPG